MGNIHRRTLASCSLMVLLLLPQLSHSSDDGLSEKVRDVYLGDWLEVDVSLRLPQLSHSSADGFSEKVRGVNLGGWLVVEGWITPSLFAGIPNPDMLDGTQVQLKSVLLQKYVRAVDGGGGSVTVSQDVAFSWETFKLWRVSESEFQFRCDGGQFLTSNNGGGPVSAAANWPSENETFYIDIENKNEKNNSRVRIKLSNGNYIKVTEDGALMANYQGEPGWDDTDATFEMTIVDKLQGDFQLANGYGHDKAEEILIEHRNNFVSSQDFAFLSQHGINTVKIPVGWWIAYDPDPPAPFIGGSLAALDRAFEWAKIHSLKCIIDLHAAPGSQNGKEHSASRDGSISWPTPENVSQTLDVIDFLAARYANHPALLGIELLNEPSDDTSIPLDTLVSYYTRGYQIVRKYSTSVYVIVCQRGNEDPAELYHANIGTSNVVVDLHNFNFYDQSFDYMNVSENIEFIYMERLPQVQALNRANGPLVFIGEWVNEWSLRNASRSDYQMFGKAQLDVYGNASFGWSYSTLRNDNHTHWDFKWNIDNQYLLLGN